MRSRYTAFVLGDLDHIEATHAPEVRGDFNRSAAESVANDAEWLGLDVRGTIGGGADDQEGEVEFVTNFMRQGKEYAHHEIAVFRREQGNWMYVKGRMNPKPAPRQVAKVGRNEPCPCGSGRKFKKCCGA